MIQDQRVTTKPSSHYKHVGLTLIDLSEITARRSLSQSLDTILCFEQDVSDHMALRKHIGNRSDQSVGHLQLLTRNDYSIGFLGFREVGATFRSQTLQMTSCYTPTCFDMELRSCTIYIN